MAVLRGGKLFLKGCRKALSRSALIALGVISILVIVGISMAVGSARTTTSTQISQSSSAQTSSIGNSSKSTTVGGNPSSATSVANNGLMLNVTISPVSFASGGSLAITSEVYNTLSSANNVSAFGNWAFPSLVGQCKGGFFNVALYSGHDTSSNISSASAIPWYPPGGVSCPPLSGKVGYYIFSPRSDQATAYPNSSLLATTSQSTEIGESCSLNNETSTLPNGDFTTSHSIVFCTTSTTTYVYSTSTNASSLSFPVLGFGSIDESQYYDSNSSSVVNFASGQYSLLVGDIWGSYVILYFTTT
jgi:hypothetical protein